jgi:hypothetical protein
MASRNAPKPAPKPSIKAPAKPTKSKPTELWGAGDPNYIKNMIAAGKARQEAKAKQFAGNDSDNLVTKESGLNGTEGKLGGQYMGGQAGH